MIYNIMNETNFFNIILFFSVSVYTLAGLLEIIRKRQKLDINSYVNVQEIKF
jgi:hypothetical protein